MGFMSNSVMRIVGGLVLAVFVVSTAWAHHECGAVRSVVIEYHSEVELCLSPDSTITIYYDKDDKETHREVVTREELTGVILDSIWAWDEDTVWYDTPHNISKEKWKNIETTIDSLLKIIKRIDDSTWLDKGKGDLGAIWQGPAEIEPTIFECKPARIGEYSVIELYGHPAFTNADSLGSPIYEFIISKPSWTFNEYWDKRINGQ